ncbi:FtsX-like permease family protein [Glaciihabitans arcticus]|uniref:FtsX-like permease family protein n=1 Tax=Glaciihabitans arcticus TaxID=2668039 RepID=A0A4Q9GS98_9MICO|nr:ABC transporter permease [Glaciihabitans arcticus]TBN57004.1 FtsX-like permease family protein [Glaciihabitans arcticus]
MRALDIIRTAVANSFRSRLRTSLTVIAIFIGAFTLTITNGLGTGINNYIETQLSSVGASDVMTVTKPVEAALESEGPAEYDPDAAAQVDANGPPGTTVTALDADDLETLRGLDGVLSVEPSVSVRPDFVEWSAGDSARYEIPVSELTAGMAIELVAGEPFAGDDLQLVLPTDYIAPLGFDSNDDAIGETVMLGITHSTGEQHEVEAMVSGVQEPTLFGSTASMNDSLTAELYALQSTGLPESSTETWASATLRMDDPGDTAALKQDLVDDGFVGTTVADQLGAFTTVVDGIILVLNAFALIALLAAGFGIINTLLMSVQERTREIGLMKAMGMSGGRIFALFSFEAVFIGFLGSAIGAGIAMGVGSAISGVLANGLLANLPGLQILAFDPVSIVGTLLLVMGIAFVAAVLPASRAARQSPIDSLRYE